MNTPARLFSFLVFALFIALPVHASQPVKIAVSPFVTNVLKQEIKGADGSIALVDNPILSHPWAETQVREWLKQATAGFLAKSDQGEENVFEGRISWQAEAGGRFLSLKYTVQEYMGGAHPNSYLNTFVFDMRTGKRLTFPKLFTEPGKAMHMIVAEGTRQLGIETGRPNPAADQFQHFGLGEDGLHLFFQPYRLGARSSDRQEAVLPYHDLKAVLRPEISKPILREKTK